MHLGVNIGGIPHLAKNERDMGHPSFVGEPWSTRPFVSELGILVLSFPVPTAQLM
jgi:hypothetical protein